MDERLGSWTVILHRGGEPVTGQVPVDEWAVAHWTAPLLVALASLSGPYSQRLSVLSAVVAQQQEQPDQLQLRLELDEREGT